MKKYVFIIAFLIGAAILLFFAPKKASAPERTQIVGGDKDEHGCLGSAGYSWCESKQRCLREWEDPCFHEESFNILNDLKSVTGITFSGIGTASFDWIEKTGMNGNVTLTEKTMIEGKTMGGENIKNSDFEKIAKYFQDSGFTADVFNAAAGTIASSTGYQKGNEICVVTSVLSTYNQADDQAQPDMSDTLNVEVFCRMLEE